MKKIFSFIFLLISIAGVSQSKLYIRGDTVQIERSGGNAELILLNSTRARTNAFLRNNGNGKTGFAYALDTGYVTGSNLILRRGDGNLTIALPVATGTGDELVQNAGQRVQTLEAATSDFNNSGGGSIVHINGDTLLGVWTRITSGEDNEGFGYLQGKFSYNGGLTWGTPFDVAGTEGDSTLRYGANLYRRVDTIKIIYNQEVGGVTYIKQKYSVNKGVTWSSEVTIYFNSEYYANAIDRVLVLQDGTILYPYAKNISGGLTSTTGVYKGRLLKSTNGGTTWADAGIQISSPDSLCVEPGLMEANGKVYYYHRARSGFVNYSISDDNSITFDSTSYSIGLGASNSMTTIIYDSVNNIFIACHNRVYNALALSNDVQGRYYLDISVSYDSVGYWENMMNVDYETDAHFLQPTLFRFKDKLHAFYNRGYWVSPVFYYDYKQRILPVENLLPQQAENAFNKLNILGYPQWWQSGGDVYQRFLNISLRGFNRIDPDDSEQGFFRIDNHEGPGTALGFAPVFKYKIKSSDNGVTHRVEGGSISATTPMIETYFTKNGAALTPSNFDVVRQDYNGPDGSGDIISIVYANGTRVIQNPVTGAATLSFGISNSSGNGFMTFARNDDLDFTVNSNLSLTIKPDGNLVAPLVSSAAADTTTYKPLGISSGGDIRKLTNWPAGVGGGGLTGSMTAGRLAISSGTSTLTDYSTATFDGTQLFIALNTSNSSLKVGSIEVQPYAVNNTWFGENLFWNGSNMVYRANGFASQIYMGAGELQLRTAASGTAGGTVTNRVPIKMNSIGNVALGGTAISTAVGSWTGAHLYIDGATGLVTIPTLASAGVVFSYTDAYGVGAMASRALLDTDIPNLNASKITAGTIATARLGSGTANSSSYLRGDQTWQLLSDIATKGTYTPTITAVDNVEASAGYDLNWTKIGDMVHVFGQVEINVTSASTVTRFRASLPAASTFANTTVGGGVIAGPHGVSGSVKPNAASGELLFEFLAGTDVDNRVFHFTASYKVTPP